MQDRTLSADEISSFCLSLSLLLHAGIQTPDALALMRENTGQDYDGLLGELLDATDEGRTLADAVSASGRFPDYVTGLLEMGERSGRTEEALRGLSRYYDDRSRLASQVRQALTYPAMLLLIMLVVICVLLVEVLPIFEGVYASLGWTLAGPAAALLSFGQWLSMAMPWLLLAMGVVLAAVIIAVLVPGLRDAVGGWWKGLAGDSGVSRKVNTARMAQALSMGISAGLPLEESLALTSDLMSSSPKAKARADECRTLLEAGEPLAAAVRQSQLMPETESALLDIGMRSGTADAVMEEVSRRLTDEGEEALESAVSKVEPTLVLVTSLLVGGILLCVMLPLMTIMTNIG